MTKPLADIEVSVSEVRDLIREQHRQFAHLAVTAGPSGWDNAIFRLGDDLAVRLPRREAAAILLEQEQRWLPQLERHLPLRIPTPLAIGMPQQSFPWRWSITPWIEGQTLDQSPPDSDHVEMLAAFQQALHIPAPLEAPHNPWRSTPLTQRRQLFDLCMQNLADRDCAPDARVFRIWEEAVQCPIDVAPTWIHGDMHARNILVRTGKLCAVIDWGDMARGDRASDLIAAWTLLPSADSREQMMSHCHWVSAQTWTRARGWALLYALNVLRAQDPEHEELGRLTLQRLLEGP